MSTDIMITDTATLTAFCTRMRQEPVIMVDTEFLRENTYWPQLCLIQVAGKDEAVCIDPLAAGIDLTPFWHILADQNILKVFHAARQDLEIFWHLTGQIPAPIFDTQIAAMVCGFGDSVAYDQLVRTIIKKSLDKSSRFTDWSRRPLTARQIEYALADVTHLRDIYAWMARKLKKTGRDGWLDEEMAILLDPGTYDLDPQQMWRRLKPRSNEGLFLACVQSLAAWREIEARQRDLPRGRIIKDETLLEIAASRPRDADALGRIRGLGPNFVKGKMGESLLRALAEAMALPKEQWPCLPRKEPPPRGLGPTVELLKVLLRLCSEKHDVAAKMIATTDDLDAFAITPDAPNQITMGWRNDVFGQHARRLIEGKLALTLIKGNIHEIDLNDQ